MSVLDLLGAFGVIQAINEDKAMQADVARLVGRCMKFKDLLAKLVAQSKSGADFNPAQNETISNIYIIFKEVADIHMELEKRSVFSSMKRLFLRQKIHNTIEALDKRLTELLFELNIVMRIDEVIRDQPPDSKDAEEAKVDRIGQKQFVKEEQKSSCLPEGDKYVSLTQHSIAWVRRGKKNVCWVVDGVYYNGSDDPIEVKIKLRAKCDLGMLEKEHDILEAIRKSENVGRSNCVVRPYGIFSSDDSSLRSSAGDSLSDLVGLALEKGVESLESYLLSSRGGLMSGPRKIDICNQLTNILKGIHGSGYVHLDFNPSNVVKVIVHKSTMECVWKAIDFESAREIDEPVGDLITPRYASFEHAKFAHSKISAVNPPAAPLKAHPAMDVCSLGWIIWEVFAGENYWERKDLDDVGILQQLSIKTDDIMESEVIRATRDMALRRLLRDTLRVTSTRPSAADLTYYSKINGGAATVNIDDLKEELKEHVTMVGEDVKSHISEELRNVSAFSSEYLSRLLSSETNSLFAFSEQTEMLGRVYSLLVAQEDAAQENRLNMKILKSSIQEVNEQVASVAFSMVNSKNFQYVEQSEMLKELMHMVQAVWAKVQELQDQTSELHDVLRNQLDILSDLHRSNNLMPQLFVLLPTESETSLLARARKGVEEWFYGQQRLVFLCPVTLNVAKCGNDGKGYKVTLPRAWVQKALPVVRLGLKALSLCLKAYGGPLVPDLSTFLPAGFKQEALDELVKEMGDETIESVKVWTERLQQQQDLNQAPFMWDIYDLAAREEGLNPSDGRPLTKTGLRLVTSEVDGISAWVSEEGKAHFLAEGKGAFGTKRVWYK
eukprot:gene25610-30930_t